MSKHGTLLGSFEEVGFAVGPREGGVEVGRQAVPVPRDAPRVPVRDGLVGQSPILRAHSRFKHEYSSVYKVWLNQT